MSEEKRNEARGKEYGAPASVNEKRSVDESAAQSYELVVVRDGIKTHPQPTADPMDPLNWSPAKKHTILAIVMYL